MEREASTKITIVLLVIAIALCAYGVYRNEQKLVERKGDAICMQCIGLG